MRRLRKISIILLVCILSCVTAYAREDLWTERERLGYDKNISLLSELGVMDKEKDITSTLTRGEFAKVIVSMLMDADIAKKGEEFVYSFSDVNKDTPYASYIETVFEMGILNGHSDGTFKPDEMIHTEEVIAGFINAMGYSFLAQEKGGYPGGYFQEASGLGLLGGMDVRLGHDITCGELCKLIMNSFDVEFFTAHENENIGGTSNKFLNYLRIKKYSGIVKATEHGTIIGTNKTKSNYINVNDELFDAGVNCDELLGYPVEFYVSEDDTSKIISISIDYDECEELVIESKYIEDYRNNQYTYEENGRMKTEEIPYNAYIVYNGTAISNANAELMQPKNGHVKLLDYNDDGNYDVAFITDYAICVAGNVNAEDFAVYDMFASSRSLKFEDETEYDIENIFGEKLAISDLKKYNVLSVKQTQDKEYAKIIVSTENIQGKINEINDEYIIVGETEYEIVGRDFYGTVSAGENGTFLLDYNNRIVAFIDNSAAGLKKGYLFWGNYNDEDMPTINLKIFAETGEVLNTATTEKVVIDGVRRDAKDAFTILKKGTDGLLPQVILFSQNDEGKVTKLDTPYNNAPADKDNMYNVSPGAAEAKDSLRVLLGMENRKYWSTQLNFGGKKNISSSTVIFKVPSDFNDFSEKDFAVLSSSDFEGDVSYDIELYSTGTNKLISDIAVTASKGVGTSKYGILSDFITVVNEDNEVVKQAVFTSSYNKKDTIYITDDTELSGALSADGSVPEGSFVLLSVDNDNSAKTISVRYNSETEKMINDTNPSGAFSQNHRIVFGSVYDKENEVIAVTTKDVENEVIGDTDIETHVPSKFQCYEYDTTHKKAVFKKISSDEIVDYMHGGGEYSRVLVYTYYGAEPRMMIVYK